MTSIYCDECFNFGNCDKCNYNGSAIKISKVDTSAPEPSANCEACENYINGICIVDFPEKEE